MTRTVLTAGILTIAALGFGMATAQAAPAAPQFSGLKVDASGSVEKTHWRDRRWHLRRWHWERRHHHHRHIHRRWWR